MKSMTGMGRADGLVQGSHLRLEIKSVNHRYCETSVRLPGRLSLLEIPIRNHLRQKISRGKVDVFVTEEKTVEPSSAEITTFHKYHHYLKSVAQALRLTETISLELILAGAGSWNGAIVDLDQAWIEIRQLLDHGLADLERMKSREGEELKKNINEILISIYNTKTIVSEKMLSCQANLEAKLRKRLQERQDELLDLDPARLQMEVLYYLDRQDLSEELARLDSHLIQLKEFTEGVHGEAVGRKLDFIIQEVNREFNTIGSKCQNAAISQQVILAKAELEKIREQIQNIE